MASSVDSKQNLFRALVVVLILCGEVSGHVVAEGIRVEVDEGSNEGSQLCSGEHGRCVIEDAVEGDCPGLRHFLSACAFCLALLLMVFFFLPLLFSPALLFFLILFLLLFEPRARLRTSAQGFLPVLRLRVDCG